MSRLDDDAFGLEFEGLMSPPNEPLNISDEGIGDDEEDEMGLKRNSGSNRKGLKASSSLSSTSRKRLVQSNKGLHVFGGDEVASSPPTYAITSSPRNINNNSSSSSSSSGINSSSGSSGVALGASAAASPPRLQRGFSADSPQRLRPANGEAAVGGPPANGEAAVSGPSPFTIASGGGAAAAELLGGKTSALGGSGAARNMTTSKRRHDHGPLADSNPVASFPHFLGIGHTSDLQTRGVAEMSHTLLPTHSNADGVAFGGQIMAWMDIAAGIAAKRHCRGPAVTASMDDLHFRETARVGDIVTVRACVNRTFVSSMEVGVTVEAENPVAAGAARAMGEEGQDVAADDVRFICSGFFVFVCVDRDSGKSVPVPSLEPTPAQERIWNEAGQRKDLRKTLKVEQLALERQLLEDEKHGRISDPIPVAHAPGHKPVVQSKVEASHLVLTSHANTLGVTFGGQIMSWMDSAATISALRFSRRPCVLVAVDSMDFTRPVGVGNAVIVRSIVNRTFGHSLEVGVTVWSEDLLTGEVDRCNGANMTFMALDIENVPMPVAVPQTQDEIRDYHTALTRRRHRIERKVLFETIGEMDKIPSSKQRKKVIMKLTNLVNAHSRFDDAQMRHGGWEPMHMIDEITGDSEFKLWVKDSHVLSLSEERMCCMLGAITVPGSPIDVLDCILKLEHRVTWDALYTSVKSAETLGPDRRILQLALATTAEPLRDADTPSVDLCVIQSAVCLAQEGSSRAASSFSVGLVPVDLESCTIVTAAEIDKGKGSAMAQWFSNQPWLRSSPKRVRTQAVRMASATEFMELSGAEGIEFVVVEQSVRRTTVPKADNVARGQMFAPSGFILRNSTTEGGKSQTSISYCSRQLGNEAFGVEPLVQWDLFSRSLTNLKALCEQQYSKKVGSMSYSLM